MFVKLSLLHRVTANNTSFINILPEPNPITRLILKKTHLVFKCFLKEVVCFSGIVNCN